MDIIEAFAAKNRRYQGGRDRCVRRRQTKWFQQID